MSFSQRDDLINRIRVLNEKIKAKHATKENLFNQYKIIFQIQKYLELGTKSNSYLNDAEKQGLCNGLSSCYLYAKSNRQGVQFFERLRYIANVDLDKDITNAQLFFEFEKFINLVRWLHLPGDCVIT